ncbi:MAG: beta-propeller fold lactonase family protein [Blastocatellia bacterium]
MKSRILKLSLSLLFTLGILATWQFEGKKISVSAQATPNGSTQSSPIAVSPNDKTVWAANPDTDSVSVFNVENDSNKLLAEIKVGDEPNNLAITPDGQTVYVANTVSGSVSVINAATLSVKGTILVGVEPYGLALTPNGSKLYVTNARSDNVSVISTTTNTVTRTITGVGVEPRAIAITSDNDADDLDEKVFVAQFNSVDVPNVLIGADNYKEGRVSIISTSTDAVTDEVVLPPMADVGFKSKGSSLACKLKGATDPTCTTQAADGSFTTGAFPNSLNSIAIKNGKAYLPNNAASPDGPVRFNVNVQAFLNVIDTATNQESKVADKPQSINMNRGINFEAASPTKLFIGMPWHAAFEHKSNEGYVVASAANILVKVTLDADGTPTINAPTAAGGASGIVRIKTGQKPVGVAINNADTRGYVLNEVGRSVTVVDLTTDQAVANLQSSALPTAGTLEATVHYGKAIFYSSAEVDVPTGPKIPVGRLSSEGWSGCVSCHANGLTDQVVWIFGAGPRRSLPLNATFNPHNPNDQKALNYSAIFDEVQDFENNIRGTSGGLGLITLADGVTPDPTLNAFPLANTGRSAALDALNAFIARGIRTPISPFRNVNPFSQDARDIAFGRRLFVENGCVKCHGGGGWSSARRDFTPAPAGSEVVGAQLIRFLRQTGTFNPNNANEVRQNGAAPLGNDGFCPPSLLGAWAMGPLLHNGSAITIDDITDDIAHRRAGLSPFQRDLLNDARNRAALVKFLKSIDASTPPISASPFSQ